MSEQDRKLVEVSEPNLYRKFFPYAEFPKVEFDDESIPYDTPEQIWITDTTFRDGQQARPPYTPEPYKRFSNKNLRLLGLEHVLYD